MKTLIRTFFCMTFLIGWALAALSLHVVRTPSTVSFVPKDHLSIADTYVDTRTWTVDDLMKHPVLVTRLVQTNQTDLLRHVNGASEGELKHVVRNAAAASRNSNTTVATIATASKDWWELR